MRHLIIALVLLLFAVPALADFEVGYTYVSGAKTGTPTGGRIRIVAFKVATFEEGVARLPGVRAAVDPLVSVINLKQAELGYKPIGAYGFFVDSPDR